MAAEGLPVEVSTRVCGVSVSGFYDRRTRPPSERAIRHAWLTDQIIEVHATSRGTYGSRRVHAELTLGRGLEVGYHQVTRLMARAGIQGLPGNRRRREGVWRTDCAGPGGPELRPPRTRSALGDRHHRAPDSGGQGLLLCRARCLQPPGGRLVHRPQTSTLVTNALRMAIANRRPVAGSGLIIHSDQGVQFTSWAFTRRAQESGLLTSINRQRWRTRVELANAMFEYLEIFHNRQRRHSALGMLTRIECEMLRTEPSIA